MASWFKHDKDGLTRDQLLSLRDSMRDQRNTHRTSVASFLRFFVSLSSAILAVETAFAAFGVKMLAEDNISATARLVMTSLFLILPVGLTIAFLLLHRQAQQVIRKEYEKLLEYLTVEQKIEALLGFHGPLPIELPEPIDPPFPEDASILFPRWLEGRAKHASSNDFVDEVAARPVVFYAPLRNALRVIFWLNIALAVLVAAAAVVLSA